MEPPIGYGSAHRSIFPESQFRTDGGSVFQGAVGDVTLAIPLTSGMIAARLADASLTRGRADLGARFGVAARQTGDAAAHDLARIH